MDILQLLKMYLDASEEVKSRLDVIVGFQEQSVDVPSAHLETPQQTVWYE